MVALTKASEATRTRPADRDARVSRDDVTSEPNCGPERIMVPLLEIYAAKPCWNEALAGAL